MNIKIPDYGWNGLWLVEWNEDQGAFHVEPALSRFGDSIRAYYEERFGAAWVALGIFNSYKEAQGFVDLLRAQRDVQTVLRN